MSKLTPARVASVDALRALALLPVLVVNALTYAEMPGGAFFGSLAQASVGDMGAVLVVATFLQGKGIALLTFLFGYSLLWSRDSSQRLKRLLPVGLLHGSLVYLGDIVHQYAILGRWALPARQWSWPRVFRSLRTWIAVGTLSTLVLFAMAAGLASEQLPEAPRLVAASTWYEWAWLNFSNFLPDVPIGLLVAGPIGFALILLGVAAGRLRVLHHPRWRGHWERAARFAPWALLLNLLYAGWMVLTLREAPMTAAVWTIVMVWLGPLTLLTWVPWLLLRVRWPTWLSQAGRNTLSMYVGGSVLIVLGLAGPALAWQPSALGLTLAASLAWLVLAGCSARAAAQGRQLPLEAWVARRRAA